MRLFLIWILIYIVCGACQSQTPKTYKNVGGPCEGCEAIHEYENRALRAIDTLPDFIHTDPKLKITGTVYQSDGITPAPDVILYLYHTNRNGLYPTDGEATGWARRHGYIRGWLKTDQSGRYTFYTFRPASYPNRDEPEHIHITIKEPYKNEYYIDEFVFDDDPLLIPSKRNELLDRGGSGILRLSQQGHLFTAQRDIILGYNIPNYP